MKLQTKLLSTIALSILSLSVSAKEPLKIDGKTTLYQRVLTTPNCELKKSASDKTGTKVDALSRFYVYSDDGKNVEVGPDTTGKISGFLDKSCVVDWKIQTALVFTNPAHRNRAVIFDNKDALTKVIEDKDPKSIVEKINNSLKSSGKAQDIISQEPDKFVDYKKQFYLLPILNFEESMFDDGNQVRQLQIASVNQNAEQKQTTTDDKNEIKTFKAAVVFVIDSTISMNPFIQRTKQAINTVVQNIQKEHLESAVNFGLIAFRSNTKAAKGIEYDAKIFVKPGEAKTVEAFEKKLSNLKESTANTVYYDEDSYAGINKALQEINWSDYGGRYVVLITDAGAIEGNDKWSTTGLNAKELKAEASHKGVAIFAMHLLADTPNAKKDAAKAKAQYTELTYNDIINKPLYYPVDANNVEAFGHKIDELSSLVTSQVKSASLGEEAIGTSQNDTEDVSDKQMADDTKKLGLAMQLAYLGSKTGTQAPSFFDGWIADRDLVDHGKASATPVVLLTKAQLSSLKEVTSKIVESANIGQIEPDAMFDQLRSIAVSMGRDPNAVNQEDTKKLGQKDLLGEYLEDLPYKSTIQDIDEDTWSSMGPDEQNRIIMDLESKLNYYQQCNDDNSRWVKLNKDADVQESVYPIPLEELP